LDYQRWPNCSKPSLANSRNCCLVLRCRWGNNEVPYCAHLIAEEWQSLVTTTNATGHRHAQPQRLIVSQPVIPDRTTLPIVIELAWAQCKNTQCAEIIVRVTCKLGGGAAAQWLALPKTPEPEPTDARVPAEFAKNYREAQLILKTSPRMAAVLARR